MTINQVVANETDREVRLYSGSVSNLHLDGLVLPMTPDLAMFAFGTPMFDQLMCEARGDQLHLLPEPHEDRLRALHEPELKYGKPFWVPSRSAHVIDGHNESLARTLIYVVAIDVVAGGHALYNREVQQSSIGNALDVAEERGLQSVGIPPLLSVAFAEYDPVEEAHGAIEVAKKRIKASSESDGTLQSVYVLIPDDKQYVLHQVTETTMPKA